MFVKYHTFIKLILVLKKVREYLFGRFDLGNNRDSLVTWPIYVDYRSIFFFLMNLLFMIDYTFKAHKTYRSFVKCVYQCETITSHRLERLILYLCACACQVYV